MTRAYVLGEAHVTELTDYGKVLYQHFSIGGRHWYINVNIIKNQDDSLSEEGIQLVGENRTEKKLRLVSMYTKSQIILYESPSMIARMTKTVNVE